LVCPDGINSGPGVTLKSMPACAEPFWTS
jgi:hypothetical protein